MANAVYALFKQSLLAADTNVSLNVDTTQDGVYTSLQAGYTYSAAHQYFSSASGTVVGTDQRNSTPTVTTGTFKSDNLTYTAVTGSQVTSLVLYRHNSGANTTWRLVLYLDTGVTGLPVTPNSGNITVSWNASGIFTLSDSRCKENICQIGVLGSLSLYRFNYRGDFRPKIGLMAQQVETVIPQAIKEIDGLKRVDYALALRSALQGIGGIAA